MLALCRCHICTTGRYYQVWCNHEYVGQTQTICGLEWFIDETLMSHNKHCQTSSRMLVISCWACTWTVAAAWKCHKHICITFLVTYPQNRAAANLCASESREHRCWIKKKYIFVNELCKIKWIKSLAQSWDGVCGEVLVVFPSTTYNVQPCFGVYLRFSSSFQTLPLRLESLRDSLEVYVLNNVKYQLLFICTGTVLVQCSVLIIFKVTLNEPLMYESKWDRSKKGCYKLHNSHLRAIPEEKINSFQKIAAKEELSADADGGPSHYFFSLFCSFAGKKRWAKSSEHLHNHKYLLEGWLMAVIKAGTEWFRCLLYNCNAQRKSGHVLLNFSSRRLWFILRRPDHLLNLILLVCKVFGNCKVNILFWTWSPPRIRGRAVQKASNKREGHICTPSDVHWSDR